MAFLRKAILFCVLGPIFSFLNAAPTRLKQMIKAVISIITLITVIIIITLINWHR